MNNKLQNTSLKYIEAFKIICFILFVPILYFSMGKINTAYFQQDKMLIMWYAVFVLYVLLAAYAANRWLRRNKFVFYLLAGTLALRVIWTIFVKTGLESDFYLLYKGAVGIAREDYSFIQSSYFTTWVYQLGYTIYQGLLIKLLGENTLPIKLLNCVYSTLTVFLVYLITTKCFNKFSGRIAALLYAVYLPGIAYCSVLTNQHIASFLFYLGLYLVIMARPESRFIYWTAGIILSLGNIMRPFGVFVLSVVTISMLIKYSFSKNTKSKAKRFLINYSKIIISYFIVFYTVSYLIISAGITEYPLINRNPMWKLVLGLNHETSGRYSPEDEEYLSQFPLEEGKKEKELEMILERLSDSKKLIKLMGKKYEIMWGDYDSSIDWSFKKVENEQLKASIKKYERFQYTALVFYIILGLGYLIIKKPFTPGKSQKYTVFILLVTGYILIHLLIEIQTRYRHFILPSFHMLGGYGVYTAYYMSKSFITNNLLQNRHRSEESPHL